MRNMLLFIALLAPAFAGAQPAHIPLDRPGEREFVLDLATLIEPADEEHIRQTCDAVLTSNAIPIIVLTITTMAFYDPNATSIETFARTLYDQWGIGHPQVSGQP